MLGRAGAILAATALSLGAAAAAEDGMASGGGLWDSGASARIPREGAVTRAARAGDGVCELEGADRARTTSARCIACHDGTAGRAVEVHTAPDGIGRSHPVEVDYGAAAARQPGRYHPAAMLPREIPLVDGKVACTSCHDGASREPKRVAMRTRLCESCHDL